MTREAQKDMGAQDEAGRDGLPVVAVFGPTASGKSAVARVVADRTGGDVVSADAMQVYRELPVLTNQDERPARLVGIWPLSHEASVGEYAHLAHEAIDELLAAGRPPVVAGGTGLYLRAALVDLALPPPPPAGARERYERLYDELGGCEVHRLLARRDPGAAASVHPNDRRRVVRALELADAGASLRPAEDRLWGGETRHPTVLLALEVPRDELERRIRVRTARMFAQGVQEEARAALARPLSSTARHVIGLKEAAELPPDEAAEAIVRKTLRYAAYQRKWLRRLPDAVSLRADRPPEEVAHEVLEVARTGQRLPARRAG